MTMFFKPFLTYNNVNKKFAIEKIFKTYLKILNYYNSSYFLFNKPQTINKDMFMKNMQL
jgi:hypothetical protein